jgi:MOSC domain-containing protein YiiM
MATIASITPKPKGERPEDRYLRESVAAGELLAGHGLAGDSKALPTRQLNVMFAEVQAELAAEGFSTGPGQMGEQLVLAGLDPAARSAGTRLQLGEAAVIEIIKPRTGCSRFESIQGKSLAESAGRLGVMAQVLTGGPVQVGDEVAVVEWEDG